MNYKSGTNSVIKPFSESIGRPRLTKTKSLIFSSLLVGVLITMLSAFVQAAEPSPLDRGVKLADTFSILLQGPYKPVVHGPDLGLVTVDLSDGSYSKTKIYHVHGKTQKPIGTFYVQFAGTSVAYDLPGGAIAMAFTALNLTPVPDGQGGTYLVGTAELDITEATGIYQSFVGGHNTMVDILHQLPDGTFVEHCICIISRKV